MSLSKSALDSAESMFGPLEETPEEKAFKEIVLSCVLKPEGHKQKPLPDFTSAKRLYAVTTLAPSRRYGGTRTPVVCDSFERAQEIVLTNEGDIFETSYHLVVIEASICNYLYSQIGLEEQYWYVWEGDSRDGGYKPIEIPEAHKCTIGWGIG